MPNEFIVKNGLIVSGTSEVSGNLLVRQSTDISGSLTVGLNLDTGTNSTALGTKVTSSGNFTLAQGDSVVALGIASHAEGSASRTTGVGSHAEGYLTLASGIGSHAEGRGTTASGDHSHAEGSASLASGHYSHAEGLYTTASGLFSHAEGSYTFASGSNAHAEGVFTRAEAVCHAEGYYATASGLYTHAEGGWTSTTNLYSHAEGYYTSASGQSAHAEGRHTLASQAGAHAEGSGSVASGLSAHSEGLYNSASGDFSHAEGAHTVASGIGAHTEGSGSVAAGNFSHAEGGQSVSSGNFSHAEGGQTVSSGEDSHAEGTGSMATGIASHAEGGYTLASGLGAHAEGLGTTASANYQHVEGKYNATSSTALWIVGDGLSNTDKKNLVTAFRDHLVISGSQSITGSFNSISSSVNVDFGRLNVTSGSIHMNSGSLGTNIYGTSSWADQLTRGPVFMTASAPSQVPSGGLWWNTNENNMYVQTASPSGSTWTSVVNQTVPYASGSRTVISQFTPGTYGGTIVVSEGKVFYVKGVEGNVSYNRGNGSNGNLFAGLQNMYQINFPDETSSTLVSASTYGNSAFALFNNGNLYTWGRNAYGQLGLGDTTDRTFPVLSNTNVVDVYWDPSQYHREPDYTHIFIKKTGDQIFCCGYNGFGQLGLNVGDTTSRSSWTLCERLNYFTTPGTFTPHKIYPLGGYTGITVAQSASGQLYGCGYNANGVLGTSDTTNKTIFVSLTFNDGLLNNFMQDVCFGGGEAQGPDEGTNVAFFFDDGSTSRIRGAGYNSYGTIGNGSTSGNVNSSTGPTGFSGRVQKIARAGAGIGSIWVLKTDGTLWNWGYNGYGQLDRGNTTSTGTPAQVETGVLDILYPKGAAYRYGYEHASPIIRKADGYYRCGANNYGQLGDGTTTQRTSLVKMKFPGGIVLTQVGSLSTTNNAITYYAVDTQNRIYAWGYNGDRSIELTNASSPVTVPIQITPGALIR